MSSKGKWGGFPFSPREGSFRLPWEPEWLRDARCVPLRRSVSYSEASPLRPVM